MMNENDFSRHTYDGQDDNHKVEDVPTNGEIMSTECNYLEYALCSKDDDENHIDPIQDFFFLYTLLIGLDHHCHHVKADQHHDENIKNLFGHQVEHQTLKCILLKKRTNRGFALVI